MSFLSLIVKARPPWEIRVFSKLCLHGFLFSIFRMNVSLPCKALQHFQCPCHARNTCLAMQGWATLCSCKDFIKDDFLCPAKITCRAMQGFATLSVSLPCKDYLPCHARLCDNLNFLAMQGCKPLSRMHGVSLPCKEYLPCHARLGDTLLLQGPYQG